MSSERYRVAVQGDHLSRIASAAPEKGLAEIIWNSLDADATHVDIQFVEGVLGVEEVVVRDNGEAFDRAAARGFFESLGGSWKSGRVHTKKGRALHGAQGEGRFKAFALGRIVEWDVTYGEGKELERFRIVGRAESMEEFEFNEMGPDSQAKRGVTVRISELHKHFQVLQPEIAVSKLLPIFALYLRSYPGIVINVAGIALGSYDEV